MTIISQLRCLRRMVIMRVKNYRLRVREFTVAFNHANWFLIGATCGIVSIAERNFNIARRLHHLSVRRDQSQSIHGIGDWNMLHLVMLIADH